MPDESVRLSLRRAHRTTEVPATDGVCARPFRAHRFSAPEHPSARGAPRKNSRLIVYAAEYYPAPGR